jgi:uncharacterized protein
MKKYFLFLCSLLCMLSLHGYTVKTVPNPKTADARNFVSNPDGILDNNSVAQINAVLQSLESDTKAEVTVVVLQTIGDEEIEGFAVHLFQEWGVGKKSLDNGLLILFVMDQRAVRFETGYGLEGVLPDAICKRIQTQLMIPEFKNGNYGAGLLNAVERSALLIRKEPVPELSEEEPFAWFEFLFGFVFLLFFSLAWMGISTIDIKRNKKLRTNLDRYLALKSQKKLMNNLIAVALPLLGLLAVLLFFSSLYVFLLILIPLTVIPANMYAKFQMKKFRNQPVSCDVCGTKMRLLSEKADNAYLSPDQDLEEKIHSVDYDVFLCDKCSRTVVYGYDNPLNRTYTKCPKCHTKAFRMEQSYTALKPTLSSGGMKRTVYVCRFCNYTENKDESLPRLQSTGYVGPIGGGRSSFGGGSFGGGRSGGGGATSRW